MGFARFNRLKIVYCLCPRGHSSRYLTPLCGLWISLPLVWSPYNFWTSQTSAYCACGETRLFSSFFACLSLEIKLKLEEHLSASTGAISCSFPSYERVSGEAFSVPSTGGSQAHAFIWRTAEVGCKRILTSTSPAIKQTRRETVATEQTVSFIEHDVPHVDSYLNKIFVNDALVQIGYAAAFSRSGDASRV